MILSIKSWGTKKKLCKPVTKIYWPEIQTRRLCVYIHVYHIINNRGPGPYNSLHHVDNRIYFLGLSLMWNRKEALIFTWREKWEEFGDVPAEKKITLSWLMNSNMIKPEKSDHLHLVYHFTVSLSGCGFESGCCHLNFGYCTCSEQEVPWDSGNYRV